MFANLNVSMLPKPDLRICFLDFWPEWNEENFISDILSKEYNLIIDFKNPDVVFHSAFAVGNYYADRYNCKKVLFLGENMRPQKFNTNFSISFDKSSNTNFRLPLWQAFILKKPEYISRLLIRHVNDKFERFASFTVSNPNNFMRNSFFQQLSSYRFVHSYGRYMNNDMSLQNIQDKRYWRDVKDEFFMAHPHKYGVVYENTNYPYYCTEKLMDAFLTGQMPIYTGDPKVGEDWNVNAFISGNDLLGQIKHLDQNNNEFQDKYYEPVFTVEQENRLLNNLASFEDWLINIVSK